MPYACASAASPPTVTNYFASSEKETLYGLYNLADIGQAILSLDSWGIDTSVYNIPLCLLDENIRPFATKSISDWKVKYLPECDGCPLKEQCCGLFATSRHPFVGIGYK